MASLKTVKHVQTTLGSLCIELTGAGPTVLFLHGSGSSRRSFDQQVRDLGSRYRCIAWDAPGYGDSTDPPFQPNLGAYAAGVRALLEEAIADVPVHLVGVSWGGLLAIETARRYPRLLRSLALIGPSLGNAGDETAAAETRRRVARFRESKEAYVADRVEFLSRGKPKTMIYRQVADNMLTSARSPGFEYAMQSMIEADVWEPLRKLDVPLYLMWGAHDQVAGEKSRTIARLLDEATCWEIPDAGHLANQDRADLVNERLRLFWEAVDAQQIRAQ